MNRRLWVIGLSGLSLSILGAECVDPEPPVDKPRVAALRGFSSGDELRSFLADQATKTNQQSGGGLIRFFFMGGAAPAAEDLAGAPTSAAEMDNGTEADNFSTTNIQEAGVDESDIIKNDGEMIYMLAGDKIRVVRAAPVGEMEELPAIELPDNGDSIYLRGTTLVALSQTWWWGGYWGEGWASPGMPAATQSADMVGGTWNDGAETTATILDVTDPANPVVTATLKFEGGLTSSRLIGGKLHLVLTTTPRLPENPTPLAVESMTLDQWIPDFEKTSGDGSVVDSGDIVPWDGMYRPEEPNGYAMTVVVTLDVDDPDTDFESTAVSANAGIVYASTDSLYLTDTDYDYDAFTYRVDTIVHKLAFTEVGTDYVASGLVPGRPLSQYSLGEHEDYLRIATTSDEFSAAEATGPTNAVYVLGENGSDLDVVGKVEGIAPGEQIYAARFIGDRGFLVTFRRVDPLFTMDLSDPTDPKVVGELKVPGYSDHIQLMDANHLMTIGKDAQEDGDFAWVQGVQLSIFDISDMASPKLLEIDGQPAKVIIGGRGTSSEANYNPKAFNYFQAADLLAFPVDVYEDPAEDDGWSWGEHEFTGLYVYHVTPEDGFDFLGRIESSTGESNGCFFGYYGTTRGVFIDDVVYSVTERDVKAASVDDVGTIIGEVVFTEAEPLVTDCFWGEPEIVLPGGVGLR